MTLTADQVCPAHKWGTFLYEIRSEDGVVAKVVTTPERLAVMLEALRALEGSKQ